MPRGINSALNRIFYGIILQTKWYVKEAYVLVRLACSLGIYIITMTETFGAFSENHTSSVAGFDSSSGSFASVLS